MSNARDLGDSAAIINFIDGKDNILLSDIKLYNNKSKLLYHVKNNTIIYTHQLSNSLYGFGGGVVVIDAYLGGGH